MILRDEWRPGKPLFYTGPSMNPTLKAGDLLFITAYNGNKIRRGDVIVFRPPDQEKLITHRVISVEASGVRARGDNNSRIDPWILSPGQVIGKVTHAQRAQKRRRIVGGFIGIFYAIHVRGLRRFEARLILTLRPLYRWLLHKDFLKQLGSIFIKPRVIAFSRPAGTELQLLIGRYVIGRHLPMWNRWQIKRLFRLFVDEAKLPQTKI